MKISRVYPKGGRWWYLEDLQEKNPKTGRPKQKWHPLTRCDEGDQALLDALREFKGSPPPGRGNMPARLEEFRRSPRFRRLSFNVRKEYERMYGVIGEAFADFNDIDVLPADVLDFLDGNFAEHPTARGHYKARLSTFFSWCVLKDYLKVNPCREIKLPKPPKRRGKMSWPTYWAMFDALPEGGRLFLELVYLLSQRPTEPRLLRESWILPDRIRFEPTKTEHSSGEYVEIVRSPRINELLDRLRELRAERLKGRKVVPIDEQRDPYLFVNERGEPLTKTGVNSMWRRARDRAVCPEVTTRDIRSFALSQMEADGHPLEAIRQAAAHTKTGQTDDYLNQHRERLSTVILATPTRQR